jgi:hypothetical protein
MPSCPIDKDKRDKAEKRAMKMKKLFKEEYFDKIMAILDLPHSDTTRKTKFDDALGNAFVQPEKDWLWNYLQHCNEKDFGGWAKGKPGDPSWLPDALASSGW